MAYIIGVDIGGTFTDCIIIHTQPAGAAEDSVSVRIGKASSTPPDFQTGFIDALHVAAHQFDVDIREILENAQGIYHGCTVGTNALVEHRTAKVGLLATRGHSDSIFIMRAGGRLKWMPAEYIAHVAGQTKPEALVPKHLCEEVDERIAFDGNVLVELEEEGAKVAIQRLLNQGVEAFAVSLLWSTANNTHEQKIRTLIQEMAPDTYISLSSEVIPRSGEYERMVATVVNSLIGPPMDAYLKQLEEDLKELGYFNPVQLMSCSGGLIDSSYARVLPVLTVGSGPVAGLIGVANLANNTCVGGGVNVITADMGGTTLDVGLISKGVPVNRPTASYGQYEYFVPTLDVRSIGAGGGSIIHSDAEAMHVGPQSAGARPGPACYDQGGIEATITDANVVLGYLNPDYYLGGKVKLNLDAARTALEKAGAPLKYGAEQTAAAAARIVDNQMADAIRLATIQQGYDARDFTLYAYGGAGAAHATAIAEEIGIQKVIIPLSNFAAGWSAFGIAAADALVVQETAVGMTSPFNHDLLNEHWSALEEIVTDRLVEQGVSRQLIKIERFADMRYSMQVNQIEVKAPAGVYDTMTVKELVSQFEQDYERLFGKGSGYAAAGIALTALRLKGSAKLSGLRFDEINSGDVGTGPADKGSRAVIWYERGLEPEMTAVYAGQMLKAGERIVGPAIIEYPDTTIILRLGNAAHIDEIGCVVIDIHGNIDKNTGA